MYKIVRQQVLIAYPRFARGYVVIDSRDPQSLQHVIGSRIYVRRSAAAAALERAQATLGADTARYVWICSAHNLDADGVVVNARGEIRMRGSR